MIDGEFGLRGSAKPIGNGTKLGVGASVEDDDSFELLEIRQAKVTTQDGNGRESVKEFVAGGDRVEQKRRGLKALGA